MRACRAICGYCGATWRTSRPCATPEETLTFCCSVVVDTGTGTFLTILATLSGTALGKPPGIEGGVSAVPFGAASSFLAMAMLLGLAEGGRNIPLSLALACFWGAAFASWLEATVWSFGLGATF